MLNDREITVFMALAKSLNYTVVAKELYMSQPGVSKTIAGLEKKLGAPLFERSTHSVRLTAVGEKYRDFLLETLDKYHELELLAKQFSAISKRKFIVAYTDRLVVEPAPYIALRWMQEEYSDIEVKMLQYSPNKVLQAFNEHSCDVAVLNEWHFPRIEKDIKMEYMCSVPITVLVSGTHKGNTKTATWKTFEKEPLIVPCYQGETISAYNQRAFRQSKLLELDPSSILWAKDVGEAYVMTELGLGIFQGFSLVRKLQGRNIISYSTGKEDKIAAFRHEKGSELAAKYMLLLKKAYAFQLNTQLKNMSREERSAYV